MYENGLGVEQDYKKASEYYVEAAKMGHPMSYYGLGVLFYFGNGVEQDYEKAMICWDGAAQLGYPAAFEAVGELYRDGLGVKQDYEKAADWFHKAVEMGETNEAQANYDKLIEEGKILKDYVPKEITFLNK